jgi:hypothetical protein
VSSGKLADFVEENGSSVRRFKSTEAELHRRPGERALFRGQRVRKKSAKGQELRSSSKNLFLTTSVIDLLYAASHFEGWS